MLYWKCSLWFKHIYKKLSNPHSAKNAQNASGPRFVKFYKAQQNINFSYQGFSLGATSNIRTVLLQNLKMAHIINPLSEANQN
jgi:hypothetical protein